MNSPTRFTLSMSLVALASALLAMYYYPWPEFAAVDAEVGQLLFPTYQANQIRGIEITNFNRDQRILERIQLVRRGEKWTVPSRQDFIATESLRIGMTINALNERTIFEVISENQQDHIQFGVLDPGEFTEDKNVAALGKKLVLSDRNNQILASVIVGSPVKGGQGKHYVRIPGKPRVYTIEFDPRVLTTNFPNWVSPDLLGLQAGSQSSGRKVDQIEIDNYRLGNAEPRKRQAIYQAVLFPGRERVEIATLKIPTGEDSPAWRELSPTPEMESKLLEGVEPLVFFALDDVNRKPLSVSEALNAEPNDEPSDSLNSLAPLGFSNPRYRDEAWHFDSANGQINVTTSDGVTTTIWLGGIAGTHSSDRNKLNYYVMVRAAVDPRWLLEPVRPADLPHDDSEENKAFLRGVQQWSEQLQQARRQASDLNAVYDDWFYLVGEDRITRMRPDLPLPALVAPAEPADVSHPPDPD